MFAQSWRCIFQILKKPQKSTQLPNAPTKEPFTNGLKKLFGRFISKAKVRTPTLHASAPKAASMEALSLPCAGHVKSQASSKEKDRDLKEEKEKSQFSESKLVCLVEKEDLEMTIFAKKQNSG